jgi:hypothetical protein
MTESLAFNVTSEAAAQAVTATLRQHGLNVIRSFDLRSALAVHSDCQCPHHGTAQCTCQFVVLLAYGESGAPVVVTVHSRDAQAQVQIARDANARPEPRLVEQVMAALFEAALTVQAGLPCPTDVRADAHQEA